MMNGNQLLALMEEGESQTLEFKESLSSGRRKEGIVTLVAFANRDGGRVLFGVDNEGSLRGVNVGQSTVENFAEEVASHTYLTLPVHLETVELAGKSVLVAATTPDRPPVIGFYACSERAIDPDSEVSSSSLEAFRRVGRANQRVDFMWLRPEMPSDPKLRLNVAPQSNDSHGLPETVNGQVWIEQPSATAHFIQFTTEPALCEIGYYVFDLPVQMPIVDSDQFRIEFADAFVLRLAEGAKESEPDEHRVFCLSATYRDDFGLTWEVRRHIGISYEESGVQLYPGVFARRINAFPAKSGREENL